MPQPHVLILRAPGTNCDLETAFAFEQAGAQTERLHVNRLLEIARAARRVPDPLHPRRIQLRRRRGGRPHPGQPDPASPGRLPGRVQGRRQADPGHLQRLSGADQVGRAAGDRRRQLRPPATLTWNDSGKFEDRWVRLGASGDEVRLLRAASSRCTCRWPMPKASSSPATTRRCGSWTRPASSCCGIGPLDGRRRRRRQRCRIPTTPTARSADVAGVCDATGRVCGLMPHPERHIDPTQHPRWTRGDSRGAATACACFKTRWVTFVSRLAAFTGATGLLAARRRHTVPRQPATPSDRSIGLASRIRSAVCCAGRPYSAG